MQIADWGDIQAAALRRSILKWSGNAEKANPAVPEIHSLWPSI